MEGRKDGRGKEGKGRRFAADNTTNYNFPISVIISSKLGSP